MSRQSEYDANRDLKESSKHVRKPHPKPRARMSWLEAVLIGLIGLIVAVCIAALSYAGQWLDSIDFAGWLS